MPDWKTRLAVSCKTQDGSTLTISPIDSFTPSFALNAEALHSLEQTHVGVVYSPKTISFSLTVKAISPSAAQLTALALSGTRFSIILQESENGTDWSFKTIVMNNCIITSATPTAATVSGVPTASFSGFSLQSVVDGKADKTQVTVP